MSPLNATYEHDLGGIEPNAVFDAKVQNPNKLSPDSQINLISSLDDAKRNALLMNSVSRINQTMKDSFQEDPTKIAFIENFRTILSSLRERLELILDQLDPEIQILKKDSENVLPCNLFIEKKMKQAEEIGIQIQNIERIINNSKQSKKTKI